MSKVENGSSVKIHYKGTLDDGTIFDDSRDREQTLDFKLGEGKLLPEFESAVMGMILGETKTFKIESTSAYGELIEDAIVKVPRSSFPEDFDFTAGNMVMGKNASGHQIQATILSHDDETVVLDHNHPLAGQDLNFEVELLEVL